MTSLRTGLLADPQRLLVKMQATGQHSDSDMRMIGMFMVGLGIIVTSVRGSCSLSLRCSSPHGIMVQFADHLLSSTAVCASHTHCEGILHNVHFLAIPQNVCLLFWTNRTLMLRQVRPALLQDSHDGCTGLLVDLVWPPNGLSINRYT